ncbi:MAG: squalene/phytoene synthase family protein, partial [Planctomycetota bacterium]
MSGPIAPPLDAAFAHCTRLARRTGKNFYWSFLTLPRDQRRDMGALYAFMRITDDLGDDPAEPLEGRRTAVLRWRTQTEAAMNGESGDPADPHADVLRAFADVTQRRAIPAHLPLDVIDGVAADLEGATPTFGQPRVFFENAEQRDRYCYHVAGAVGLCCLHVWGCDGLSAGGQDEAAREP